LTEQRDDVARLAQLRELARIADERWASKPSVLDAPNAAGHAPLVDTTEMKDSQGSQIEKSNDPWENAQSGMKGNWVPETWTPNATSTQRLK